MRKFILGTILATAVATVTASANAGGYPHYHYGPRHYHHNNGQIAMGIIGGAIIASAIANQQRQIVVTPQIVSPIVSPQIVSPIPQPMVTQGNCLVNIYNPYMQRYENVVVTCIQQ
jgi:hypothetical protein